MQFVRFIVLVLHVTLAHVLIFAVIWGADYLYQNADDWLQVILFIFTPILVVIIYYSQRWSGNWFLDSK